MITSSEKDLLEEYAKLTDSKIFSNQADLNPKDRALPEMLAWCRRYNNVVVLNTGIILSAAPTSRLVQNCKIVMQEKGLVPGAVYPATLDLIHLLLENADEAPNDANPNLALTVSAQQQRLRLLVKEALELEASDIHIEVRKEMAHIRFRKHGELFLHAEWLPKLAREVVSVAFNKETDHSIIHFNPAVPQNASMPLEIEQKRLRLRLASLPAQNGFDVVMRILTTEDDKVLTLEQLGYLPQQIALIKKAISMPAGAVILSGPTGSGKTTTLATCMNLIGPERKIYTIEDPVEKLILQATQIPVNVEHQDRSFANMARTVLRMDPDVLVLGEMRDEDTAKVMVRAAMTGHLVFSTLHTKNATGIIMRLNDLGVTSSVLANPNLLVCLICQRLVPILCTYCSTPITVQAIQPRWQAFFGERVENLRRRHTGHCIHCNGLGIRERTIVAEIIWLDEQGREFILHNNILAWKQYLQDHGWQSYQDHLLELVALGRCDPLDAEKILGEIYVNQQQKEFNYLANI